MAKAKRALNSWTRVKCMKNGRFIKEFAKSRGYNEVCIAVYDIQGTLKNLNWLYGVIFSHTGIQSHGGA